MNFRFVIHQLGLLLLLLSFAMLLIVAWAALGRLIDPSKGAEQLAIPIPPEKISTHEGQRPLDAGAHRGSGDAQTACDLGIVEVLEVTQVDGALVGLGESQDRVDDIPVDLELLRSLIRRRHRLGPGAERPSGNTAAQQTGGWRRRLTLRVSLGIGIVSASAR